jgi:hypothetical protein
MESQLGSGREPWTKWMHSHKIVINHSMVRNLGKQREPKLYQCHSKLR